MMVLCGGALMVGIAASLVVPFIPFAIALTLAVILGAGWAAFHAVGIGQVLVSALGLLLFTQVGYGLGVVGAAALESIFGSLRRSTADKPVPPALPDLHIGEKR